MKFHLSTIKLVAIMFLLVCLCQKSYAQDKCYEFGNINHDYVNMSAYAPEPNADALVISKYCQIYGENIDGTEKVVYDFVTKIKIFSENGVAQYSNVLLNYFPASQQLLYINANSYNKDASGNIIKTELKKEYIMIDKTSEEMSVKKIPIPNVKVGSVIEYRYTLITGLNSILYPFRFGMSDPVLHAELRFQSPKIANYSFILKGDLIDRIKESNKSLVYRRSIDSERTWEATRFYLDSIPSLKDEEWVNHIDDHNTELFINMASYIKGGISYDIFATWKNVLKEVSDYPSIGKPTHLNTENLSLINSAIINCTSYEDTMKKVFSFIKSNLEWNHQFSVLGSEPNLQLTLSNKKGNSADINMILKEYLHYLGFNVKLALTSTVYNGKIINNYPYLEQFNHLVCAINRNGKISILDASQKHLPYYLTPVQIYGAQTLLVDAENVEWVQASNNQFNETDKIALIRIKANSMLADIKANFSNYSAAHVREFIVDKGIEKYKALMIDNNSSTTIENTKIINLENTDDQLKISYTLASTDFINFDEESQTQSIQPFMNLGLTKNPLNSESRSLPLEFETAFKYNYKINIEIPEGYELAKTPTNAGAKLNNNGAQYSILYVLTDNYLQINASIQCNKNVYSVEEYPMLKSLFDDFIKQQSSYISLTKKP